MKPMLDIELKAFEKAAESGLDRVLANVMVILGICLSTGLAPWTTVQSQDSTATQIGSYATILAIGAGGTALIASLGRLSNATRSAKTLERFQLHMISLDESQHKTRLLARVARYKDAIPHVRSDEPTVTWLDLVHSTSPTLVPLLLVWGPALGLLRKS